MKFLALLVLPIALLASEHTYMIGGGNGKLSPDKKWYASLLDYQSEQNKEHYLEFTLYNLQENGIRNPDTFTRRKKHLPHVKLLIPLFFSSRLADLEWSEDSAVFTAKFKDAMIYYNIETKELKILPTK